MRAAGVLLSDVRRAVHEFGAYAFQIQIAKLWSPSCPETSKTKSRPLPFPSCSKAPAVLAAVRASANFCAVAIWRGSSCTLLNVTWYIVHSWSWYGAAQASSIASAKPFSTSRLGTVAPLGPLVTLRNILRGSQRCARRALSQGPLEERRRLGLRRRPPRHR